jgi:hypothetical protein
MCPDSLVLCPPSPAQHPSLRVRPVSTDRTAFLNTLDRPSSAFLIFSSTNPPKSSTKKHIVHQSVRYILLLFSALPPTFLPATHAPSLEIDPDRQQQSTLSSRSVRPTILLTIYASQLTTLPVHTLASCSSQTPATSSAPLLHPKKTQTLRAHTRL